MKLPSLKQTALAAISLTLSGCAGSDIGKDATALVFQDKAPVATDTKDALGLRPATDPAAKSVMPATGLAEALHQAETLRKSGDLQGAAHTLSQLVLVAPDDPRVMAEYGKTLVAEGRSDDALAFLERAIELKPGDWSLYSAQGVAFDQKGNYKAAQIAYGRALIIKPGEPSVLSNDALSHMQAGDLDSAERLLLQASEHGVEYPRIASNLALVKSLQAGRPEADAGAGKPAAQTAAAAPDAAGAPQSAAVTDTAVEHAPLPMPASDTPKDIEALEKDPSVVMQAVPTDQAVKTHMPEKQAAGKQSPKKPLQTLASDDQPAPLRRLSDSDDLH